MVGTILPIVYGARDSKGGKLCLWLRGIGCGFGGIVLGCAVGVFGWIIPDALRGTSEIMVAAIGGAIHLVAAAHDLRLCQMPVPVSRWQVPQKWSRTMPLSTVCVIGVRSAIGIRRAHPHTCEHVCRSAVVGGLSWKRPGRRSGAGCLWCVARTPGDCTLVRRVFEPRNRCDCLQARCMAASDAHAEWVDSRICNRMACWGQCVLRSLS